MVQVNLYKTNSKTTTTTKTTFNKTQYSLTAVKEKLDFSNEFVFVQFDFVCAQAYVIRTASVKVQELDSSKDNFPTNECTWQLVGVPEALPMAL